MNISRRYKKYVAGGTALALAAGSIGMHAWTGESLAADGEPAALVVETRRENVGLGEADKRNLSKDETVYVIAAADGGPREIIVSDWIKNAIHTSSISDATGLTDIVNVKGTESFCREGDYLGVWDADGNDIYYQGSIEKELPVDMKVEYFLNGNRISPDELAGKSGHVVIRFSYTNNQKQRVMIKGEEKEMYVPFVALTTMMLDNGKFRNVEVSKGKVINDGEHLMVVGYAMPGMQENLEVEKEDLDIPDYVEISGDVSDFQLAATMTMVSNNIFRELDTDSSGSMDELSSDLDELQDAMNQLMDGCSELYDGISELYDKSGDLKEGTDKMHDGAVELSDGARSLKDGAGTLKAGAVQLNEGLETLNAKNDDLVAGAKAEFEGLLQLATMQLKTSAAAINPAFAASIPDLTMENYGAVLDNVITMISGGGIGTQSPVTGRQAQAEAWAEADRRQIEQAVERIMREKIRQELMDGGNAVESIPAPKTEENVPAVSEGASTGNSGEAGNSQVQPEGMESLGTSESLGASGDNATWESTEAPGNTAGPESTETSETTDASGIQDMESGTSGTSCDETSLEKAGNEMAALAGSDADRRATVVANDRFSLVAEENVAAGEELEEAVEEAFASPQMQEEFRNQVNAIESMAAYDEAGAPAAAGAADPAVQLKSLKALLDGYNQVYQGLLQYTAGVSGANAGSRQLAEGSRELWEGAEKLYEGTKELRDGSSELNDGGTKLIDGVLKLKDGGLELKDGAEEFNEEGIKKLVDVFEDDIEGLMDRMDAMKEISSEYRSFAGIREDMEGSVKFIYKTEGIETK